MDTEIMHVPLEQLVDSPSNPRRTMGDITELADSVRAQGVLQPICVRRVKRSKPARFEIVYGHRRVRAARAAELATIPAIVRELTDRQVLEVQLLENSQRADVQPLEEADAIETLRSRHGATTEEIAAHLGRPRSWVLSRLRLCDLGPAARKAFGEGRLSTGVAVLLARLEGQTQADATKAIAADPPITLRTARQVIEDRFSCRLADADFDPADATLVPAAGACGACPHRTGSQLDLLGDVPTPDLCMRPACYQAKKDAAWERRAEDHQAKGLRVLTAEEAKGIWWGDSEFVSRDWNDWSDPEKRPYRETMPDAEVVLARDERGRVHELLVRPDRQPPKTEREEDRRRELERAVDREVKARVRAELLDLGLLRVDAGAVWRFLARVFIENLVETAELRDGLEALEMAAEDLEADDAAERVEATIAGWDEEDAARVGLALAFDHVAALHWKEGLAPPIAKFAADIGLDLAAIEKTVRKKAQAASRRRAKAGAKKEAAHG